MCMIDDAEWWQVYRQEDRTARKSHECFDCRRTIHPGERYHWSTGLLDDVWQTHKVCAHCIAAASWLRTVCDGWLYGGIREDLVDHWNSGAQYRSLWLGRAIVGIRRRWRDGADPVPEPFVCRHRGQWGDVCMCGSFIEVAA